MRDQADGGVIASGRARVSVVTYNQLNPFAAATPPYGQLTGQLSAATLSLSSGNQYASPAASPQLSVAQQLQSDAATYRQAQRNGTGAASLLETAAQGLGQIGTLIQTLRGLAVQASDKNITDQQRSYLQAAFTETFAAIDTVANGTSFGGQQLLDGAASDKDGGAAIPFVLGQIPRGVLNADIRSVTTARLFSGSTPDLANATDAASAVTAVDAADALLQPVAGAVAGYQASVASAGQNNLAGLGGSNGAQAALSDTDITAAMQLFNALRDTQQTGLAVLAQARSLDSGLLALLQGELKRALVH